MLSIVQHVLFFPGGDLSVFFVYQAWSLIQLRRFSSVPELYEGSLNLNYVQIQPVVTPRQMENMGTASVLSSGMQPCLRDLRKELFYRICNAV